MFSGSGTAHLSVTATFVYNYLAMIVSITFGLLWSVAHHGYMRMEPWFQLSRARGAMAEDSLLTQYPYLFPLRVPFEAVKRG